jgi:hypothetical protein
MCEKCATHEAPAGAVRAVLIDPELGTLQEGMLLPGDLDTIYGLLDCDLIDAVRFEDGHAAYVDDEGLLKNPRYFTVIDGQPYAGRALFVGPVDEAGLTTACTLPIEWFAEHVKGARAAVPAESAAAEVAEG